MSFQRHHEKIKHWREWIRRNGNALAAHGVPRDAFGTELDWFLFLDHGYIQSAKVAMADWWTIKWLSDDNAKWLADFVQELYPDQYPDLVTALRRQS